MPHTDGEGGRPILTLRPTPSASDDISVGCIIKNLKIARPPFH